MTKFSEQDIRAELDELKAEQAFELEQRAKKECREELEWMLFRDFDRYSDEELKEGCAAEARLEFEGADVYTCTELTSYFKDLELTPQVIERELNALVKDALDKIVVVVGKPIIDGRYIDAAEEFRRRYHPY